MVVPPEILESAKRSVSADRINKKSDLCVVCGGEATMGEITGPADQLCWVCRRLKISAWGESEQQVPAQE